MRAPVAVGTCSRIHSTHPTSSLHITAPTMSVRPVIKNSNCAPQTVHRMHSVTCALAALTHHPPRLPFKPAVPPCPVVCSQANTRPSSIPSSLSPLPMHTRQPLNPSLVLCHPSALSCTTPSQCTLCASMHQPRHTSFASAWIHQPPAIPPIAIQNAHSTALCIPCIGMLLRFSSC